MQLIPVYLYPNRIEVYTNVPGQWRNERYRRVYNRNVKIFRGLDNRVDIQVRNSDEKALDTTGYKVYFNLVERNKQSLVLTKECVIVSSIKGKFYVTLTEVELYDINNGFYQYSLHRQDSTGHKTPLYVDSQYGANATIEVVGDVRGDATPSLSVTTFTYVQPSVTGYTNDPYYTSSIINANYDTSVSRGTHTFALYASKGYTGNLTLQGSLSDSAEPIDWVTINTLTLANSTLTYYNTVGKWKWFRFTQQAHLGETATFTVQQTVLGSYIVNINEGGRNYAVGEQLIVRGDNLGGTLGTNDLRITVTNVDINGRIQANGITYTGQSIIDFRTFVISGTNPNTIGRVDKILYR